jgi:hypothetical protein
MVHPSTAAATKPSPTKAVTVELPPPPSLHRIALQACWTSRQRPAPRCLVVTTNRAVPQRTRLANACHVAPQATPDDITTPGPATSTPTAAAANSSPRHPAISPPSRFHPDNTLQLAALLRKSPPLTAQDGSATATTPRTRKTHHYQGYPATLQARGPHRFASPRGPPCRTRSHRHIAPQLPPPPTLCCASPASARHREALRLHHGSLRTQPPTTALSLVALSLVVIDCSICSFIINILLFCMLS